MGKSVENRGKNLRKSWEKSWEHHRKSLQPRGPPWKWMSFSEKIIYKGCIFPPSKPRLFFYAG